MYPEATTYPLPHSDLRTHSTRHQHSSSHKPLGPQSVPRTTQHTLSCTFSLAEGPSRPE